MNCRNFCLQPFGRENTWNNFRITGDISRDANILNINWNISGPIRDINLPTIEEPARAYGLWEETCFELFLGPKDSEEYWEFNLSPSGRWNIFRFNAYRQGMEEEPAFDTLPFSFKASMELLQLALEFDPGKIIQPDQAIHAAACAVIRDTKNGTTYWALAHHGNSPDFHRRDGFLIEL
jgi:hypothetical protein